MEKFVVTQNFYNHTREIMIYWDS